MEQVLKTIPDYLINVVLSTGNQLIILFLPTLVLSVIMHFLSEASQKTGYKLLGEKLFMGIFGWLGTAIHETGHAVFALIFFHKITDMKLFSLKNKTGTIGYVSHTWNSRNPVQAFGNFFIGIGPILFGSFILLITTYLLFSFSPFQLKLSPVSPESFSGFAPVQQLIAETGDGLNHFFTEIFAGGSGSWWKILLFLYLVFATGSSVSLSVEDIKGAFKGFLIFVGILTIFNLLTIWIGSFATDFFRFISSWFSIFYFLMIISILLNLLFLLLLLLLNSAKGWVIRKSEEK